MNIESGDIGSIWAIGKQHKSYYIRQGLYPSVEYKVRTSPLLLI